MIIALFTPCHGVQAVDVPVQDEPPMVLCSHPDCANTWRRGSRDLLAMAFLPRQPLGRRHSQRGRRPGGVS